MTFRGRGERRAVRQTVRRSGRQLRKLLDRQMVSQSVRQSVCPLTFFLSGHSSFLNGLSPSLSLSSFFPISLLTLFYWFVFVLLGLLLKVSRSFYWKLGRLTSG